MRVCTICGAKWRGEPSVCPLDGGPLRALPDPLIGRTIGGRYVITDRIGAGGMGIVYRARHEVVGRDVAIKFLSPDLAMEPNNRKRFLREAKAANRIDHEHIIDITDYGETDDGLVYLVMEYLDGEPLSKVIARGPLAPYRALDIAMQMAAALARAHELDVVHRDIKPDNVYVLTRTVGGDFIKLLDFGLAKMKGEMRLTASGAVFGTPEYMAPEQARGSPLTGKADLYGLGCVLYEMLSGRPPFSGSAPDLILKHIREPPPRLEAPDVPPELEALVMRLLEKDPARRHADAYHVLEELRAIGETLPRPSTLPTIPQIDAAALFGAQQDHVVTREVPREPSSNAPEAWARRLLRLRELSARAHPEGPPLWLTEAFVELDARVAELGERRAELDAAATAARKHEEEARNVRLRLGRAVDVLGRDESRLLRELEELSRAHADARQRLAHAEPQLREAWRTLPPPGAALSVPAAEAVERAGLAAGKWLEASRAAERVAADITRLERERDDVRFQVAQLKGRLGTLGAEVEYELAELRERMRRMDEAAQILSDRTAPIFERIVRHFLSFPALADAVRAVG